MGTKATLTDDTAFTAVSSLSQKPALRAWKIRSETPCFPKSTKIHPQLLRNHNPPPRGELAPQAKLAPSHLFTARTCHICQLEVGPCVPDMQSWPGPTSPGGGICIPDHFPPPSGVIQNVTRPRPFALTLDFLEIDPEIPEPGMGAN